MRYKNTYNRNIAVKPTVPSLLLVMCFFLYGCETTGPRPSVTNKKVMTQSDKALIHAKLARGYLQQKQYNQLRLFQKLF